MHIVDLKSHDPRFHVFLIEAEFMIFVTFAYLSATIQGEMTRGIFRFQAESAALQLGTSSKSVNTSITQMISAASQGNENYTGMAVRDTAGALKDLTMAVHGVASTTNNRETQEK